MSANNSRVRTSSECSDVDSVDSFRVGSAPGGISYDVDGKFSFSQVLKPNIVGHLKSAVDENGKFDYIRADVRPVPPGWYDLDRTKHAVPKGWYILGESGR